MADKKSVSVSVTESDGIKIYTLRRAMMEAKITEWGATIMSLSVPDNRGNVEDVVLGFDTLEPYMDGQSSPYFGAVVGRVANRIGGASFSLDGETFNLAANEGSKTLHGGHVGFDKVVWQSSEVEDGRGPSVKFWYTSGDGEQGFPGQLDVSVTYTLSADLEMTLEMEGRVGGRATPVNLANHTYWNLRGHGNGDILGHKIRIWGSHITPVDDQSIPTGEIAPVEGTPFDFTKERAIGARIGQIPGGYDHNYALDDASDGARSTGGVRKVARVAEPEKGRVLEVFTDAPGMQFYTSNSLGKTVGKGGAVYKKYAAFCLETQGFPDAVNKPGFPSVIVQPGDVYRHVDVYRFSTF